ncbi:ceramide kinase isoform X2 [Aethina tumida]|uniref:ceramide kinase isoform X2 n=1 Tax=Aethina tumida TaxID=116153 RepID=UPI0021484420|nr:ceramide kinase isoform X2 [Aethina tumida]
MSLYNGTKIVSPMNGMLEEYTLPVMNIIAVHRNYLPSTHPAEEQEIDPYRFTIHYAERPKDAKWVYKKICFKHTDAAQVTSWVTSISTRLKSFKTRPKHILLFVNPFGGKKNAMKIYEKYGKPLFHKAGIEVTVNVSQRKDQIKDFLIHHNLDMYDSVACVGGDGTVSELFNGLVLRECKKDGVDANDINQVLPKPKLPIGIIPGGSTDTIAYCIHGTTDPTTAVLQIIFGDTLGLDLVSVHDENSLLRLFASVFSYGYLGDVAYHSDRFRWMGPRRYDYSGLKKLVANKGYSGQIAIFSDRHKIIEDRCRENCSRCLISKDQDISNCQWEIIEGKYFMVSAANISCACSRAPKGIAPYSHLGDGMIHLVLVKHTSFFNNIRLLFRLSSKNQTVNDLPFVETYCGREFCFRATDSPGIWNGDGEIQQQTNIRAKVRCQLLTIYSRGSPHQDSIDVKCCAF